jgi:hypothetical protein
MFRAFGHQKSSIIDGFGYFVFMPSIHIFFVSVQRSAQLGSGGITLGNKSPD